jgi:hypothetical protein
MRMFRNSALPTRRLRNSPSRGGPVFVNDTDKPSVAVERVTARPREVVSVEVYAQNSDPAEDERLNAYAVALDAPTFRENGGGPRFLPPPGGTVFEEPTTHPYVFRLFPGGAPIAVAGGPDFN